MPRLLSFVRLSLFVLLVAPPLLAQPVLLGVKAGSSRSTMQSTSGGVASTPWGSRSDPSAGISAAVRVRGPLSVQVEGLYARRGWADGSESNLRLDYLEMPVLLRLAPEARRAVIPVVLLGVAPSTEVSCGGLRQPPMPTGFTRNNAAAQPMDCSSERQRQRDLGLVGSIGVDVPLRSMAITTELRHTRGTRDLTPLYSSVQRNRSMAVLVGVRMLR